MLEEDDDDDEDDNEEHKEKASKIKDGENIVQV